MTGRNVNYVQDELLNTWELTDENEMFSHLSKIPGINKENLKIFIDKWYNDSEYRLGILEDFYGGEGFKNILINL